MLQNKSKTRKTHLESIPTHLAQFERILRFFDFDKWGFGQKSLQKKYKYLKN